jgi:hypothetical protein
MKASKDRRSQIKPSKDRQSKIKLNELNPNEQNPDKGPDDTRPYLCIPYWETPLVPGNPVDIGQLRPLPAAVISWECPGIHTTPYVPGQDLQVTVDVRNSGLGSATAVATVLVCGPIQRLDSRADFFGATTVTHLQCATMVTGYVSATLSGVIPASAPNHVTCWYASHTRSTSPVQQPTRSATGIGHSATCLQLPRA